MPLSIAKSITDYKHSTQKSKLQIRNQNYLKKNFMSDQLLEIKISATAVAWYGAITATVSIIIAMLNYLRDKPKVKIEYSKNIKISNQQNLYDSSKTYFNISVINKGRRSINITKASIRILGLGGIYLLTDSFSPNRNRILTEENPTTQFLTDQNSIDFSKIWYIAIHDATGKEYRKYFHLLPTFWRIWCFIKLKK